MHQNPRTQGNVRKRLPSGPGPDMFASDFKARIQRTANNGHTTTETKVAEPTNDPLMQEIEDELRQEQMKKMWAVYGKYVIGIVVAVVMTVALACLPPGSDGSLTQ